MKNGISVNPFGLNFANKDERITEYEGKEYMEIKKRIDEAAAVLRSKITQTPEIGIVLGSGLGEYGDELQNPTMVSYQDIPGFPVSTVEGHAGQFIFGERILSLIHI